MKKTILFFSIFIFTFYISPIDIYQNYVQAYGEGPKGRYLLGFESKKYTEEDTIKYAKQEMVEFLSGMIYGYNFVYKVENKLTNRKGYFELNPITRINVNDRNIKISQFEEKDDAVRFQAIYRLSEDQKTYLRGFQSSLAKMSMGEAKGSWVDDWDKRLAVYKDAMKNAVLNEAKSRLKSRPLFVKGKLLLIENPKFGVISGEWKVKVKVHIMVSSVEYEDVY